MSFHWKDLPARTESKELPDLDPALKAVMRQLESAMNHFEKHPDALDAGDRACFKDLCEQAYFYVDAHRGMRLSNKRDYNLRQTVKRLDQINDTIFPDKSKKGEAVASSSTKRTSTSVQEPAPPLAPGPKKQKADRAADVEGGDLPAAKSSKGKEQIPAKTKTKSTTPAAVPSSSRADSQRTLAPDTWDLSTVASPSDSNSKASLADLQKRREALKHDAEACKDISNVMGTEPSVNVSAALYRDALGKLREVDEAIIDVFLDAENPDIKAILELVEEASSAKCEAEGTIPGRRIGFESQLSSMASDKAAQGSMLSTTVKKREEVIIELNRYLELLVRSNGPRQLQQLLGDCLRLENEILPCVIRERHDMLASLKQKVLKIEESVDQRVASMIAQFEKNHGLMDQFSKEYLTHSESKKDKERKDAQQSQADFDKTLKENERLVEAMRPFRSRQTRLEKLKSSFDETLQLWGTGNRR